MSEDTDIAVLGENIVHKCGELIPDEWLPKVVDLLGELQLASAQAGEGARKAAAAATQAAARGESIPAEEDSAQQPQEDASGGRKARPQSAARHGRARTGAPTAASTGTEQGPAASGAGASGRAGEPSGGGEGRDIPHHHRVGGGPATADSTQDRSHGRADRSQPAGASRGRSRPSSPKLEPLRDDGPAPLDLSPDPAAAADLAKHTARVTRAEETTRIDRLDDYMEDLYEEDIDAKTQAALKVLSLARYSDHLGTIVDHETLLDALARMAREEYKKNTELTTTLMEILYCISHYSDFHRALTSRRVGEVAMKVAELENARYTARSRDLDRQVQLHRLQAAGDKEAVARFRQEDEEARVAFNEGRKEQGDGRASGASGGGGGGKSGRSKGKKSGRQSSKAASGGSDKEGRNRPKIKLKSLPKGKVDISKERRRFALLTRRQERLLYYCFHVLLNLASDSQIEEKMVRRGIIGLLAPLLERPNPELLLLVVTFLRNLALVEEFADAFVLHGDDVIRGLATIIPCGHTVLAQSALRLLFALSFDIRMVKTMVAHSLVPRVAQLLREKAYRQGCLRLMYHMSMDDPTKRLFTRTEAMSIVIQLVTHYPKQQLPAELAGMAINLTLDPAAAADIVKRDLVAPLVKRATTTKDPSTVKILRNVSQYTLEVQCRSAEVAAQQRDREVKKAAFDAAKADGADAGEAREVAMRTEPDWARESGMGYSYRLRHTWQPHVHSLVRLLGTSSPELLVEALGLLSNLTPRDMPTSTSWGDIAGMPRMMELVESNLAPGVTDDDVLLEAIQFTAAMALDRQGAKTLGRSHVPGLLAEIVGSKGDDPEIVNQACTAVFRLLHQKDARNALLYETEVCSRLGAYLGCEHEVLAANADDALSVALEYDRSEGKGEVWRRIQLERFRAHNREWCEAASRQAGPRGDPFVAASYINGDSEDDDSALGGEEGGGREAYRLGRATHEMVAMDVGALEADADTARRRALAEAAASGTGRGEAGGFEGGDFDGGGRGYDMDGGGGDGYYGGMRQGGSDDEDLDGAHGDYGAVGGGGDGYHVRDSPEVGPASGAGAGGGYGEGPMQHSTSARMHPGAGGGGGGGGGRASYSDMAVGRSGGGGGGGGGGMYWGSGAGGGS